MTRRLDGHRPDSRFRSLPSPAADARGFSLVETSLAMLMIMLVMLAMAQLFAVSVLVARSSEDITQVTSLAGAKVEQLKYLPYDNLAPGGSLTADIAGYWDTPDLNADGTADYTRRWLISEVGNSKQLEVRVVGMMQVSGRIKETTVGTVVARR